MKLEIFLENLKIALSAIWANKIRSFLTILGVVIGVFSVIMIVAITSGLKDEIATMIASLGSDVLDIVPSQIGEGSGGFGAAPPSFSYFSEKELREFQERTRDLLPLQSYMYQLNGRYEYQDSEVKGFLIGTQPDYFKIRRKQAIAGNLYDDSDERGAEKIVVLGYSAATELFGQPQYAPNKKIRVNGKQVRVLGVLEKENLGFGGFDMDKAAYLPATTTKRLFDEARVMEIFVQARSEEDVPRVERELNRIMKDIRPEGEYSIFTQESIMDLVNDITSLLTAALAGLTSISLVVGGIGIMNIMLVSVTERTREIGIRKAVGATNNHILTQFLTEAVILCLVGGAIGLLIAAGGSIILTRYAGLPTLINWQTIIGAISFSIVVGVAFGITPAIRAAQKDPIEALRYE